MEMCVETVPTLILPNSIPAIKAAPTADISGEGIRMTDLFVRSAINCRTKSLFDIPPSVL